MAECSTRNDGWHQYSNPMACKLCGADQFRPWLMGVPPLGSRVPSRFGIERCEGCGLLQTRPEPSPEELREAYGAAYTWQTTPGIVSALEALYRQLLVRSDQARAVRFAARLADGADLLDVGCGDGLLVAEARRAGLLAHGVDRPGAPLWPGCDPAWRRSGDIEGLDEPSGRWDVVSLFHVVEHLREPLQVLRKVHGWLRPRGILVIQVPNAASLQSRIFRHRWYGFDIPRHLVHWTQPTLTRALQQTGYEVAATRYISWRDNGPCFAGSLLPRFDPVVERERLQSRDGAQHLTTLAIRRLLYLCVVWAYTPIAVMEAAARAAATLTVFARKAR